MTRKPLDRLLMKGNEALARGALGEARSAFTEALQLHECGAAYDGLSWVDWWANDASSTMLLREKAYRLFREEGDRLGAARAAMWLSTDHDDFRGEFVVAQGWRQIAWRLLEGVPVSAEHGWLNILEGDAALIIREDPAAAAGFAERAKDVAQQCQLGDLRLVALGIEGLALVGLGHVDVGMQRLDETAAAVLGGEFADEMWANKVMCYLIYGCERIRDFDRAAQWCETMRQVADSIGFAFSQGTCRAHYGSVLISRGKWREAEDALAQAAAFLEKSRPPWAAEALVRLAELRRRQGRHDEAAALLQRAEWHPQSLLGLAEIALDMGRLADADDFVQRFLRHVPEQNRLQRAAALELVVRIASLAGAADRATAALAELQHIAEAVTTMPLRAAVSFARGMTAVSAGHLDEARAEFEDALDLFERSGTPYEAARARLELAAALVGLGRNDRAEQEARLAQGTFELLGARFSAARAAALAQETGERPGPQLLPELTARQIEILSLVARGRSDRQIALDLGISEHTVHRHVANILLRLDLPSRAAAVAHAAAQRMI